MRSIGVFVEGGGLARSRQRLRQGFDVLLGKQKRAAREKRLHWRLGFYGSRGETWKAFSDADAAHEVDLAVLLVDAEGPVTDSAPNGRVTHLKSRDGWSFEGVDANRVHLMTECMEAWIVADQVELEKFYGQGFTKSALPKRKKLDLEPKADLYAALEVATKGTKKGRYGKINHASELLKRVRPEVVAARCTSFQHLTHWLDAAISGA
jgi:hypothetical protein